MTVITNPKMFNHPTRMCLDFYQGSTHLVPLAFKGLLVGTTWAPTYVENNPEQKYQNKTLVIIVIGDDEEMGWVHVHVFTKLANLLAKYFINRLFYFYLQCS